MPKFEWTCLACGNIGQAEMEYCSACSCPSVATFKQISFFRSEYMAKGGTILPGAGKLPEEGDYEILDVFAKIILKTVSAIAWYPKIK